MKEALCNACAGSGVHCQRHGTQAVRVRCQTPYSHYQPFQSGGRCAVHTRQSVRWHTLKQALQIDESPSSQLNRYDIAYNASPRYHKYVSTPSSSDQGVFNCTVGSPKPDFLGCGFKVYLQQLRARLVSFELIEAILQVVDQPPVGIFLARYLLGRGWTRLPGSRPQATPGHPRMPSGDRQLTASDEGRRI